MLVYRLYLFLILYPFSLFANNENNKRLFETFQKIDYYADINDSISLRYIHEYIKLASGYKNNKHLSGAYRRLGIYYYNQENYSEALLYHNKALEIDVESGYYFAIASDYCNIGDVYYKQGNLDRAFELYNKTLEYYNSDKLFGTYKFYYGKGNIQGLISEVLLKQQRFLKAKQFNSEALNNLKREDNTDSLFNSISFRTPRIADVYIIDAKINYNLEQYDVMRVSMDSTLVYIKKGKLYNHEIDYNYLNELYDFKTKGVCCINLGSTLNELKNKQLYSYVLAYYNLLKLNASKNKQLEEELRYTDSITLYQSKKYNKEQTDVLSRHLAIFETEKAKYETKEAKLEAENQTQKVWIISGLFIVALVFLILIFINLETKKKSHKQAMSLKDLKIDELLRENELENLQGLLAGQEVERKRIAQDLHDTIGGMLSTIKLHFNALRKSMGLKAEDSEIFTNADNLLDESCKELRRVSHDLNTGSLASYGLKENLKTLKNALELTSEVTVNLILDALELPSSSKIEQELFKVIQELLSNTLKHAQATEINIQLSQFDDEIQLIFEDNGIGFNVNKITRGLGLDSIQKRIAKLQGTLTIDSHEKSGTTFIFEIPIKR